ncbi:hypothetical protein, partial [Enterobacter hormaechei]|uniref:hypothetical protein n=1 Tax=Enterobacter hormaechei TaxID=158836 RepID=UPI0037438327
MGRLRGIVLRTGATLVVIVALLVSGLRLALPHLDSWRPQILAKIESATGRPVADSIFASICGRQLSRCGKARRSPLTSNATITTSVAPVRSTIPRKRPTRLYLSALKPPTTTAFQKTPTKSLRLKSESRLPF